MIPRFRTKHGHLDVQELRRLLNAVEAAQKLNTHQGIFHDLHSWTDPTGHVVDVSRFEPFWAKVTGRSGIRYAFSEVTQTTAGTWMVHTGGRAGTTTGVSAYEISGSVTVPTGAIVQMWLGMSEDYYLFADCCSLSWAKYATTAALPAAYTVASDGTITGNANGAVGNFDGSGGGGTQPAAGEPVLIRNETGSLAIYNGYYRTVRPGSAGTTFEFAPLGASYPGRRIYVALGAKNGGLSFFNSIPTDASSTQPASYSAQPLFPLPKALPISDYLAYPNGANPPATTGPNGGAGITPTDITPSTDAPPEFRYTAKPGSGVYNGTTSYRQIGSAAYLALLTEATLAVRFMPTAITGSHGLYSEAAALGSVWSLSFNATAITFFLNHLGGGGGEHYATGTVTLQANVWYRAVAVFSASTSGDRAAGMNIYLDGVLVGSDSNTTAYAGGGGGVNLVTDGARRDIDGSVFEFLTGNIAESIRTKSAWTHQQCLDWSRPSVATPPQTKSLQDTITKYYLSPLSSM